MKKNYFIYINYWTLLLLLVSFLSFGQTQTFNSSGTFVVPAGVTSITVQAWGGGGAGGGSNNAGTNTARGGAGGGGGAYASAVITSLMPGSSLSIVVGAGGLGVSAGNGNSGGFSTITGYTTTIYAAGGSGGAANISGGSPAGGSGGTIVASVGSTRVAGVSGQNGATGLGINSGDGGAGANGGGAGASSIDNTGSSSNGNIGTQAGGGGSGSRTSQNGGNQVGGSGAAGRIILTWTCPTTAGTLSGNQYLCTYGSTTTAFSSTVTGGTWSSSNTGIATVNSSTGVVTAVSAGTSIITYTVASSGCTSRTTTRQVYVANGPGAGPLNLTGSNNQCQNTTTTYTITPDPYSYSYVWDYVDGGSGATITPSSDGLSATVVFGANATSGNIRVQSINACGNGGGGRYLWVAIAPSSNGGVTTVNGSPSTGVSGCANTYITNIGLSGYIGTPVRWELSTNNFATIASTVVGNSNNINATNLTQTTYFRAVVQNSPCTIAYSNVFTVTISNNSVSSGSSSPTVCSGVAMASITHSTTGATGIGTPSNLPAGVTATWSSSIITISGTPTVAGTFNYSIPLTGGCGNVNAVGTITVVAAPTASISYSGSPYCRSLTAAQPVTRTGTSGGVYSAPAGLTINSSTGAITPSTSTAGTYTVTYTYGTGSCTGLTTTTSVIISDVPNISGISAPSALCTGGTLNPSTPTITANGSIVTSQGWQISTTSGGSTYIALAVPYTVAFADNGKNIRYTATNGCGIVYSNVVTIAVNSTPTITPNKVDETCPTSNNGTISPVFSGGLSNIRYIKLTQKYVNADAWQQVQEIQAFEIFTGTNVALASNGATATASSTYQNNTTGFGPQKAIDGDFTGYSFWHSNSTNINEAITVDLNSGKNIDYLRIHNRVDCCWERGQNMLLELFDASNNLVYSRTIDLWGGVNGARYVDVNVLDVSWGDGATTLNRTGLDSGNYTLNYADVVGCFTSSTINIGSINTTTAISSQSTATQTRCLNAAFMPIIVTATGAGLTYQWYRNTTSSTTGGISLGSANGAQTNSYTPQSTAVGTLYYYSVVTGTCGNVTSAISGAFITSASPVTPTSGTITQPTCTVATGSVVLSSLPSSGSWTITATPATSGLTGLTGTGTTTTITGLTGGTTYTFTVSNGSCNSSASANVVINIPPALVTWNGSNWSSTPTINNRVEFLANYSSGSNANSPANVDACSCQVKNNAVVVFNTGHTLKVVNEVQIVAGTLTFEDDASLVQVNDLASNSGNIIYKRKTTPVNRYDFTYWSSPVTHVDMTLGKLSPTTFYDKYFIYNNAWVSVPRTTVMIKGEGYSVRAPQTTAIIGNPLPFLATFTGEPHNGEVKKTLTGNRVYLIGNPYPSAIDADQFLALNSSVLQGTLYFWTHNSPPSDAVVGDKRYNYTTNDYATYNRTGGVGTGKAATTGGLPPSGKIASAQGFFAPASAAGGELVFNNLMRLSTTGAVLDNTQFFKLSTNSKTAKTITTANTEKNRIWLNLTNSEGAFKQTLIGYVTGATNDYDGAFDGVTYDGNQFIDFYSVNNEVNLSIQGRALPFVKKDSVALGYKSTIKGDFKISIDQIDGSLATQNIFLEDKDLKVLHDLKKEAYTFSTEKGVFNNRFVLRYADKNAVDEVIVPEVPGKDSNAAVIVSVKNGEIKINANATKLDKVIVYDMAGRKLFQKNKVDTNILVIPNFVWNHQALVVDIALTNGTKHSRKIIN